MPAFGSTIRAVTDNASAMKKLAARDWEDRLQVCPPSHSQAIINIIIVRNSCIRWSPSRKA